MSNREILNFEASKKAMSKFSDDEKALIMMDMTQHLFEAHKMRHEAEQRIKQLKDALRDMREVSSIMFYAINDRQNMEEAQEVYIDTLKKYQELLESLSKEREV